MSCSGRALWYCSSARCRRGRSCPGRCTWRRASPRPAIPATCTRRCTWANCLGWLRGSYKQSPTGASLVITDVLIGLALALALLGAFQLLRARQPALVAWFALMLVALLVLGLSATTWVGAKTLMLTSPAVVLLAWGGVA